MQSSEERKMEPIAADRLMRTVEEDRRRTQRLLGGYWFPLLVFGWLALAAAAVQAVAGGLAMGVFWMVAAPLGIVTTSLWYARHSHRIGLSRSPWAYVATGAGIALAAGLLGALGRDRPLGYSGPLLAVGLGYAVFAGLERSRMALLFAALIVASAFALWVQQPPHAAALAMAAFGAGSILLAIWNRLQEAGS